MWQVNSEEEFVSRLEDVIANEWENWVDESGSGESNELLSVTRFKEAGILSGNSGLVVKLGDDEKREFQITVVRSR